MNSSGAARTGAGGGQWGDMTMMVDNYHQCISKRYSTRGQVITHQTRDLSFCTRRTIMDGTLAIDSFDVKRLSCAIRTNTVADMIRVATWPTAPALMAALGGCLGRVHPVEPSRWTVNCVTKKRLSCAIRAA